MVDLGARTTTAAQPGAGCPAEACSFIYFLLLCGHFQSEGHPEIRHGLRECRSASQAWSQSCLCLLSWLFWHDGLPGGACSRHSLRTTCAWLQAGPVWNTHCWPEISGSLVCVCGLGVGGGGGLFLIICNSFTWMWTPVPHQRAPSPGGMAQHAFGGFPAQAHLLNLLSNFSRCWTREKHQSVLDKGPPVPRLDTLGLQMWLIQISAVGGGLSVSTCSFCDFE